MLEAIDKFLVTLGYSKDIDSIQIRSSKGDRRWIDAKEAVPALHELADLRSNAEEVEVGDEDPDDEGEEDDGVF